jgi:Zn-dependent alcohol dehydrogenase
MSSDRIVTRAAVLHDVGRPFEIETVELEQPHANEVLVRMKAAGVCHSDWNLHTGDTAHPMPLVPGHEGSGVVEAVGDGVSTVQVGDHVALNWAPYCGSCFYCDMERPALCATYKKRVWDGLLMDETTRFSLNGQALHHYTAISCFADRTVVPEKCCVPLKEEVPFTVGALIGCAVTTGVGAALNSVDLTARDTVAVFGVGGVGLSIVMGARLAGAKSVTAIDISSDRLEAAKRFGANECIQNRTGTGELRVDYAFDTTGVTSAQEQCFDCIRPGGTIVLVGLPANDATFNIPAARLTRQEKRIIGSYYGSANPPRDFPLYAQRFLDGELPLDQFVSKTFSLEQINEAYEQMLNGSITRGVILFDT